MTLLRLSQLARFWEKNPRTILTWIRQGRLAAVRTPGNHYRVRVADVRAFCEREGMPVPPFVAPPPRRVVSAVALPRARAALPGLVLEVHASPYDALVSAAAGPPAALVLPASAAGFDAAAALAAIRRARATAAVPVVVVGAAPARRAESLARAGATRVLGRARAEDVAAALRELLAVD